MTTRETAIGRRKAILASVRAGRGTPWRTDRALFVQGPRGEGRD